MKSAPVPANEAARLAELRGYELLDTLPELSFDELTLLASQICGVSVSVLALVDENRQWFKSKVGVDVEETPRDVSFCAHALDQGKTLLEVEDARKDERFALNPLVTGDFGLRYYCGAPLVTSQGVTLGTLCVIDQESRKLTDDQKLALRLLADQAMLQIELRQRIRQHIEREMELHQAQMKLNLALVGAQMGNFEWDVISGGVNCFPNCAKLLGFGENTQRVTLEFWDASVHPADLSRVRLARMKHLGGHGLSHKVEYRVRFRGGWKWVLEAGVITSRDSDGFASVVAGVVKDIDERKRAETEYKRREAIFRSAIECSNEGHLLVDQKGILQMWNPAAQTILGFTEELLEETSIDDPRFQYVDPNHQEICHPALLTLETGLVQSKVILGVHRPNGKLRWLNVNVHPVYGHDGGSPSGACVNFTDVTESISRQAA
jgi:PAS domain S-box-containing protein